MNGKELLSYLIKSWHTDTTLPNSRDRIETEEEFNSSRAELIEYIQARIDVNEEARKEAENEVSSFQEMLEKFLSQKQEEAIASKEEKRKELYNEMRELEDQHEEVPAELANSFNELSDEIQKIKKEFSFKSLSIPTQDLILDQVKLLVESQEAIKQDLLDLENLRKLIENLSSDEDIHKQFNAEQREILKKFAPEANLEDIKLADLETFEVAQSETPLSPVENLNADQKEDLSAEVKRLLRLDEVLEERLAVFENRVGKGPFADDLRSKVDYYKENVRRKIAEILASADSGGIEIGIKVEKEIINYEQEIEEILNSIERDEKLIIAEGTKAKEQMDELSEKLKEAGEEYQYVKELQRQREEDLQAQIGTLEGKITEYEKQFKEEGENAQDAEIKHELVRLEQQLVAAHKLLTESDTEVRKLQKEKGNLKANLEEQQQVIEKGEKLLNQLRSENKAFQKEKTARSLIDGRSKRRKEKLRETLKSAEKKIKELERLIQDRESKLKEQKEESNKFIKQHPENIKKGTHQRAKSLLDDLSSSQKLEGGFKSSGIEDLTQIKEESIEKELLGKEEQRENLKENERIKQEIREGTEQLKEVTEAIPKEQDKLANIQEEISSLKAEFEAKKAEVQELKKESKNVGKTLTQQSDESNKIQEKITEASNALKAIQAEILEAQKKLSSTRAEISKSNENLKATKGKARKAINKEEGMEALKKANAALSSENSKLNELLSLQTAEVEKIQNELTQDKHNYKNSLEAEIAQNNNLSAEVVKLKEEIESSKNRLSSLETEKNKTAEENKKYKSDLGDFDLILEQYEGVDLKDKLKNIIHINKKLKDQIGTYAKFKDREAEKKIINQTSEIESLKNERTQNKDQIKELQSSNENIVEKNKELLEKFKESNSKVEELESKLVISLEENNNLKDEMTSLKKSNEERISKSNNEIAELKNEISKLSEESKKIKESEKKINTLYQEMAGANEAINKESLNKNKKIEELNKKIESLIRRNEQLEEDKKEWTARALKSEGEYNVLDIKHKTDYEKSSREMHANIKELKSEIQKYKVEANKYSKELDAVNKKLKEKDTNLEGKNKEIKLLKEEQSSYEIKINENNNKVESLESQLNDMQKKYEDIIIKLNSEVSKVGDDNKLLTESNKTLQNKLGEQILSSQKKLHENKLEIHKLTSKLANIEKTHEQEINQYKENIAKLSVNNSDKDEKYKSLKDKSSTQIKELRSAINENKTLLKNSEESLVKYSQENLKLKKDLSESENIKNKKISELKSLNKEKEDLNLKFENIFKKNQANEAKIKKLESEKSESERKNESLTKKLNDLEKDIIKKDLEIKNSTNAFKQVMKENEEGLELHARLEDKNRELSEKVKQKDSKIEDLTSQIKDKDKQIEVNTINNQKEVNALISEAKISGEENVRLKDEIANLKLSNEKDKNNSSIKIGELEKTIENIISKSEAIKEELSKSEDEQHKIEVLYKEMVDLNKKNHEELLNKNGEITNLNNIVKNLNIDNEKLNIDNKKLAQDSNKWERLHDELDVFYKKKAESEGAVLKKKNSEIESLKNEVKQLKSDSEKKSIEANRKDTSIKTLQEENLQYKEAAEENKHKIDSLKLQIIDMQAKHGDEVRILEEKYDKLNTDNLNIKQKNGVLQEELSEKVKANQIESKKHKGALHLIQSKLEKVQDTHKQEIEQKEDEIARHKNNIEELKANIANEKERYASLQVSNSTKIKNLKKLIQEKDGLVREFKDKADGLEKENIDLRRRLEAENLNIKDIENKNIKNINQLNKNHGNEISKYKEEISKKEGMITKIEEKFSSKENELKLLQKENSKTINNLEEHIRVKDENITELNKKIAELSENNDKIKKENKSIESRLGIQEAEHQKIVKERHEKIESLSSALKTTEQSYQDKIAEVEQYKATNDTLTTKVSKQQEENERLKSQLQNQRVLEGNIVSLKEANSNLSKEVNEVKAKEKLKIAEVEQYKATNDTLTTKVSKQQEENERLKSQLQNQKALEANIASLKEANSNLSKEVNEVKAKEKLKIAEVAQYKATNDTLTTKVSKQQEENERLKSQLQNQKALEANIASLKEANSNLSKEVNEVKAKEKLNSEKFKNENSNKDERIIALNNRINELENNIKLLKNEAENKLYDKNSLYLDQLKKLENLKEKNDILSEENKGNKKTISSQQEAINSLQEKIRAEEILKEKQNNITKEKDKQIKTNQKSIEETTINNQILTDKVDNQAKEIDELKSKLKSQYSLDEKIKNLTEENEKKEKQLTDNADKIKELQENISGNKTEIDKLMENNKLSEQKAIDLHSENKKLTDKNKRMEETIEQNETKIAVLEKNLEEKDLSNKKREEDAIKAEELKQQNENLNAEIKNNKETIAQQAEQIKRLLDQVEQNKETIKSEATKETELEELTTKKEEAIKPSMPTEPTETSKPSGLRQPSESSAEIRSDHDNLNLNPEENGFADDENLFISNLSDRNKEESANIRPSEVPIDDASFYEKKSGGESSKERDGSTDHSDTESDRKEKQINDIPKANLKIRVNQINNIIQANKRENPVTELYNQIDSTPYSLQSIGFAVNAQKKATELFHHFQNTKGDTLQLYKDLVDSQRQVNELLEKINKDNANQNMKAELEQLLQDIALLLQKLSPLYKAFKAREDNKEEYNGTVLGMLENIKEGKKQLHFYKESTYEDFSATRLNELLGGNKTSNEKIGKEPGTIQLGGNKIGSDYYAIVSSIPSGKIREYTVTSRTDGGTPLVGTFIETERGPGSKIIISGFPQQPEVPVSDDDLTKARMKYSLTVAAQVLASFAEVPSKDNQIAFSIPNETEQLYLYAALRTLGQESSRKFDETAFKLPDFPKGKSLGALEADYEIFKNKNKEMIETMAADFNKGLDIASIDEGKFFEKVTKVKEEKEESVTNQAQNSTAQESIKARLQRITKNMDSSGDKNQKQPQDEIKHNLRNP